MMPGPWPNPILPVRGAACAKGFTTVAREEPKSKRIFHRDKGEARFPGNLSFVYILHMKTSARSHFNISLGTGVVYFLYTHICTPNENVQMSDENKLQYRCEHIYGPVIYNLADCRLRKVL